MSSNGNMLITNTIQTDGKELYNALCRIVSRKDFVYIFFKYLPNAQICMCSMHKIPTHTHTITCSLCGVDWSMLDGFWRIQMQWLCSDSIQPTFVFTWNLHFRLAIYIYFDECIQHTLCSTIKCRTPGHSLARSLTLSITSMMEW